VRLTDIVSNMNLATYPQIALIIFLAVFAAITWRVVRNRHSRDYAEAAQLPLQDSGIRPDAQNTEECRS
jgi:cbb3-type cytochrome oxidase subunit 3